MSLRLMRLGLLLLGLAACAAPAPLPTASAPAKAAALPANLRPNVEQHWLTPAGGIHWPDADGFVAAPVLIVLPAGVLIDRFGDDKGRFFSLKGAFYRGRALPYVCEKMAYTAYRVALPLLAWSGKAVGWFDEPGGATQLQTDAPAKRLVDDHVIEPLPPEPDASPCKP